MMDTTTHATMTKSLPRIPDFHSMPKVLLAHRLSQGGRQETDNLRQRFIAQRSNEHRRESRYARNASHLHQDQDSNTASRDLARSAPPGFRVKDTSQRSHVVLCATNPRRMSKKAQEERAKQRRKDYISKQIYKIPTCQRPEFFIKLQVEPTPSLPYPKGTLTATNCHFNYVAPKKYIDDNYKQVLGKTTTKNSDLKAQKLSTSEARRNKIIEQLISTNKPEGTDFETPETFAQKPIKTQQATPTTGNHGVKIPSSKSLSAILNGKQNNSNTISEESKSPSVQTPTSVQRSKTVAFSLLPNNKDSPAIYHSINSSKALSIEGSKSTIASHNHHLQRSHIADTQRLTSADITTAHARHHFIHPEWPSEFINWARYAHPTTSERLRHSFI